MAEIKQADAVFEGGGVKGIGLVGALEVMEQAGYRWRMVGGTSAGAIVAALVAAGYSADELVGLMREVKYGRFADRGMFDRFGLLGMGASLLLERGVFEGNYLERWLDELLAAKGVRTFGDLKLPEGESAYAHRLQVVTSDITRGRLVVLPAGLGEYGIDADSFSVARAVRMSMSIPFFFEPVVLEGSTFVDGGLLSNFPVWLFDRGGDSEVAREPRWPTFGFKLVEPSEGRAAEITGLLSFTKQVVLTMLEAHDRRHVESLDFLRTIAIPTVGVGTTEFQLEASRRDALHESGRAAALAFHQQWDHQHYLREARLPEQPQQLAKVERWRERVAARSAAVVGSQAYRG